jgi:hypothetical protein
MSGSTTIEVERRNPHWKDNRKKRERRNFIKKILDLVSISLGSKTRLNNVVELEDKAIIGQFLRYKMSHK